MSSLFIEQFPNLFERFHERRLASGEFLFREGDARDIFYVIHTGSVAVYKHEDESFAIFFRNDFCCEQALTKEKTPHTKNGRARETTTVLGISHQDFVLAARAFPEEAVQFLTEMLQISADRLHHADNKLVTVYHVSKILATHRAVRECGEEILLTILDVIRAKKAFLVLFQGAEAEILSLVGFPEKRFTPRLSLSSDPLLGRVVQSAETHIINAKEYKAIRPRPFYVSQRMIVTPILVRRRAIGAMVLSDKEKEDFSVNNQILLEIIARQISGAMHAALLSDLSGAKETLENTSK